VFWATPKYRRSRLSFSLSQPPPPVKLLVISSVAKKKQPENPEEKKSKQRAAVHIRTSGASRRRTKYQKLNVSINKEYENI
jgi:hypothetical protein